MRVLIVAATSEEIAPLTSRLRNDPRPLHSQPHLSVRHYARGDHRIDVLTTGVGMVATAVWCTRLLAVESYDVAFNLGICGSFTPHLTPGTVVHVTSDRMAELGAEDGDAFLTLAQLKIPGDDQFPCIDGRLVSDAPALPALTSLPIATAITVNTVHGDAASIARVVERFHPDVETMEGAAFMFACLVSGVRFAQVRAVSNIVERRNREHWDIPAAIRALDAAAERILDQVCN